MSIGPPPSSLTELVLCLIQLVNKSTAVEKAILLFLAAVLFYAAANKLWQFSLPATALNLSSGTAVLIAMIEISVGTANCIGQPTGRLLLVNVALFGCFSIFLVLTAINGAVECGCFGQIEVSIWKMLAFDAMVVVTLLEVWRERKSGVGSMGIEFLSPIVLLLALSIIFPSLQSIFQQQIFSIISVKPINDMPILLDPLDGIDAKIQVEITNRSNMPVQVLKAGRDWCVVKTYFTGGTIRLEPKESRIVELNIVREKPECDVRETMIQEARSGLPVSRVPRHLHLKVLYQDLSQLNSAQFFLRTEPSHSYASLYPDSGEG
jgi:hypothetical protein